METTVKSKKKIMESPDRKDCEETEAALYAICFCVIVGMVAVVVGVVWFFSL
jgi:hypothetical protein